MKPQCFRILETRTWGRLTLFADFADAVAMGAHRLPEGIEVELELEHEALCVFDDKPLNILVLPLKVPALSVCAFQPPRCLSLPPPAAMSKLALIVAAGIFVFVTVSAKIREVFGVDGFIGVWLALLFLLWASQSEGWF